MATISVVEVAQSKHVRPGVARIDDQRHVGLRGEQLHLEAACLIWSSRLQPQCHSAECMSTHEQETVAG
jgi:hypothetical protein